MAIVSAIQEAQKNNLKSLNDYMMKVMEFMESTHAKSIRALEGGPTFMIFPQIFFV